MIINVDVDTKTTQARGYEKFLSDWELLQFELIAYCSTPIIIAMTRNADLTTA